MFIQSQKSDDYKRRKTTLVAMDALPFYEKMDQFEKKNIKRDLLKCFAGFSNRNKNDGFDFESIATGHWGCGAFNGDKEIKCKNLMGFSSFSAFYSLISLI
jgi:poly(ADP-ribose) glycohydrolase